MRAGRVAALFLAAVLFAGCAVGPAPPTDAGDRREIVGVLNGRTVLEGEVRMTGDVLVPAGSTLVVEPGTVIEVVPSESTKIDPEYLSPLTELLVLGSLQVRGTEERPVRFRPQSPSAGDEPLWAGILLDGASESFVRSARIERAETGVLCVGSSPLLQDNVIEECRYGIIAQNGSAPKILGNRIARGEGGVFCWRRSHPYLKYNRIVDNEEEGVFVDADSRPVLDRNMISGNAIGLALDRDDLPYDPTAIEGNGEDIRFLGGPAGEAL